MQPKLELLPADLLSRILEEAYFLLIKPGVKVQSVEARRLLAEAGAQVDEANEVVKIPTTVIEATVKTVPRQFRLFDRSGNPVVQYGGDVVQFDPGSAGIHILDPETLEHRPATTADLIRLVKVAEMLPQYAAQSTAVVCNEIPKAAGDLYRLYLVMIYSAKPVVTGAFSITGLQHMLQMLDLVSGGRTSLADKPLAVFDVCPSPPMIWSEFGAQNLIELARARVPAEIVAMPLAGATAPVTLAGTVVQHAAECLSGIAIHQIACPGAPIVWGGAPAIFDMRRGTTPMGAVETAMIDASYAQVGKALGLPTHAYLGASDSKLVDAQAGLESGITALVGALAGINMISGGGMLDFLACQSAEKLVVDAEGIAMIQRLLAGVQVRTEPLATALFEGINFKGDFLKQKETRRWFREEQYLPSAIIDRDSVRGWQQTGGLDTFERAREQVKRLVESYQRPAMETETERELRGMVEGLLREAGMERLPV